MITCQEFYMAVRYDGGDANTTNLELVSGNPDGVRIYSGQPLDRADRVALSVSAPIPLSDGGIR